MMKKMKKINYQFHWINYLFIIITTRTTISIITIVKVISCFLLKAFILSFIVLVLFNQQDTFLINCSVCLRISLIRCKCIWISLLSSSYSSCSSNQPLPLLHPPKPSSQVSVWLELSNPLPGRCLSQSAMGSVGHQSWSHIQWVKMSFFCHELDLPYLIS